MTSVQATITLAAHGLELRCAEGGLREDRPLRDEDVARLQQWADEYQRLTRADRPSVDRLLELGRELLAWLNGDTNFLARLQQAATPPSLPPLRTCRQMRLA